MRKLLLLATASVVLATAGSAATINGSFVISTLGANINGTNLLNSTLFQPIGLVSTPAVFAGVASGDYTAMPAGTQGTGGTIDTTNIDNFSINFAGYGSFAATSGQIVSQSANFLSVFFLGDFTPEVGGPLAGFDVSATSVRVSLSYTGVSTSYSGTLASPPESLVPEPATYLLMGSSLLGLVALRRRRTV